MKRIINHWTAGGGRANHLDKKHYHRLVEFDGNVVFGTEKIEDNVVTSDGDYARHTLNLNTLSIGVACCGMMGATESPFDAGPSPITEVQFRAMCNLNAELCRVYGIPVTPETVLTHAEVEYTLGVKQQGKWDFTRLPFRADLVGSRAVGDYMRQLVAKEINASGQSTQTHIEGRYTLRKGMSGLLVKTWQIKLQGMGYAVGEPDGKFGPITRRMTSSFQHDQDLPENGTTDAPTWAASDVVGALPLRTNVDEVLKGSRTIDRVRKAAVAMGGVGLTTTVAAAKDVAGILPDLPPIVLYGAVVLFALAAVAFVMEIGMFRREDTATGKHLGYRPKP